MRINILLPSFSKTPIGGYKVQYEYANRLVALGHTVAIYHSLDIGGWILRHPKYLRELGRRCSFGQQVIPWFSLNSAVRCRLVPLLHPRLMKAADVTILTGYQTAEAVTAATRRTGRLFQIVYDYEFWRFGGAEIRGRIERSLRRSDVQHIAGSSAIGEMLGEVGVQSVVLVTSGVDVPQHQSSSPRSNTVAFPLRSGSYKGAAEMLAAIPMIQDRHHNVEFECFGENAGFDFPPGLIVHGYLQDDDLLALYRRCKVFVLPSHAEGWGLPAVEAMANGAAVVVADNGGSRDFAVDGETAVIVPIRDPEAIADAVSRLLSDDTLRSTVIAGGIKRTAEMSWDRSTAELLTVLV